MKKNLFSKSYASKEGSKSEASHSFVYVSRLNTKKWKNLMCLSKALRYSKRVFKPQETINFKKLDVSLFCTALRKRALEGIMECCQNIFLAESVG